MPMSMQSMISEAETVRVRMNEWGRAAVPFFFLIDFEQERPLALPLDELDPRELCFDFNGNTNAPDESGPEPAEDFHLFRIPVTFERYLEAFGCVQEHLRAGNSFLVNLTFPTPVETNLSLRQIYRRSRAPYRLWWRDRLVLFSPEAFVTIDAQGRIASFPMKGTIEATLPGAAGRLLADPKEKAEHATIVDLIRNDLSMVATEVRVRRYRYVERLLTHRGELLQTSSYIAGQLPEGYPGRIGDILFRLLPAGSVSGAPKVKTTAIIREAEGAPRGYYTGVCGIFDGCCLDSAVMIRFIEQTPAGLLFRSGGGITAFSDAREEYREMTGKVYLPFAAKEPVS